MKRLHKIVLSSLALLASLTLIVQASTAPVSTVNAARDAVVDDPEPLTCPLCAGDPALHIRNIFRIERALLNVHATLLL
jgi:hypothetical protein